MKADPQFREKNSQSAAQAKIQRETGESGSEDLRDCTAAQRRVSQLRQLAQASPQAAQLRKFTDMAAASPRVRQMQALQAMAAGRAPGIAQRVAEDEAPLQQQALEEEEPAQFQADAASKRNDTGLPDPLKSGVEALSGLSLDNVRVHYGSGKPAQLNAHAYAQGTDIHVAPGQEKHLPHEAWHVVQQAQGRVRPTLQMRSSILVNDDSALEHEADVMGARAVRTSMEEGGQPPLQQMTTGMAGLAAQLMKVDQSDVGKFFNIVLNGSGLPAVGRLTRICGGGWYEFDVGGQAQMVRGQNNINSLATDSDTDMSDVEMRSYESDSDEDSEDMQMSPSHTIARSGDDYYDSDGIESDIKDINIDEVAKREGISPKEVLLRIRNGFIVNPRTLRLHFPFGSKTISKGRPAFRTPDEDEKAPQAMVSYRKGDFGLKRKIGKDYKDWAEELSDSDESETEKRERAQKIGQYLNGEDVSDWEDFDEAQKIATGGLMSVALISDPLRTQYDSTRTELDFFNALSQREEGSSGFREIFGDKQSSTFLPARSSGSAQQRERLRLMEEIHAQALLWVNNCLINAICRAAWGRNATEEDLITIRSELSNVGQMLVASQSTIEVIQTALGIDNEIVVHYPLGSGSINEHFDGGDPVLHVFHTGAAHFVHECPDDTDYYWSDDEENDDEVSAEQL